QPECSSLIGWCIGITASERAIGAGSHSGSDFLLMSGHEPLEALDSPRGCGSAPAQGGAIRKGLSTSDDGLPTTNPCEVAGPKRRDRPMPDESGANFEEALAQLEQIVDDLERGDPSLSAALARYESGVKLLRRCYQLLDGAEQAVALLTGVDDQGN